MQTWATTASFSSFCVCAHDDSGLFRRCQDSRVDVDRVEKQILIHLKARRLVVSALCYELLDFLSALFRRPHLIPVIVSAP